MGRKAGLTNEKLHAAANIADSGSEELSIFNDIERLVIELADAMVTAPANISDDFYSRLREKFSEEQLLQLSAQLAFENYRARLNRVFNIGSDEVYQPAKTGLPDLQD